MIGFWTLFKRESVRFLKDVLDTIAPPAMSVILFLLIFSVALGSRLGTVGGLPYAQFMTPGLLLMAVVVNSFLNPAYSVFQSRWDGNIADVLSSPLSSTQIALAVIAAGMLRGLIVGGLVFVTAWLLIGFELASPVWTLVYLVVVSLAFASFGSIVGLWTKGWEGVNTVSVFVLDPMVMLGGVFFSVEMVRDVPLLGALTQWNPFTTIAGGLRAAMLGAAEVPLAVGFLLTLALAVLFLCAALVLYGRGYHLKA